MNALTLGNRILDVVEANYLPHGHCTFVVECRGVQSIGVGILGLIQGGGSYRSGWLLLTPNRIRCFQYDNNNVVNITTVQPQLLRAEYEAVMSLS